MPDDRRQEAQLPARHPAKGSDGPQGTGPDAEDGKQLISLGEGATPW
jgi:hypothetical protein